MTLPVLTEAAHLLGLPHELQRLKASFERDLFRLEGPPDRVNVVRLVFTWMDRYVEHEPDFTDGFLIA